MVVGNQAAWQEGRGAERAITWLHNGLAGPGHIPDNLDRKTHQEFYDSHILDELDHAEQCGAFIDKLMKVKNTDKDAVESGKTNLQQGFMWAVRSIARPTTF